MPIYLVRPNKKGADVMLLRKNTKYPAFLLAKREKEGYQRIVATDKLTAIEKVVGVKFKR